MKIISTGSDYRVVDDSLKTYDELPVKTYTICFSKQSGFFLNEFTDIKVNEKVYGIHNQKVDKVMRTFERSPRNLGIILSGDKGIGKSLFAKLLIERGIKENIPVLIANNYIPGIADFINEIEQEVIILFDEFDKTFGGKNEDRDSMLDPQTEMLTLFDGISSGKKMFVITCNSLNDINNYLVNRPGRFHYHFRFEYPNAEEIKEYLSDKGISKEEIEKVINFAYKIKLNYDCLRAIAFELQGGILFEEAITDLNIIKNDGGETYNIVLHFDNGERVKQRKTIDFFGVDDREELNFTFHVPKYNWWDLGTVTFAPADAEFDLSKGCYVVKENNFKWECCISTTDDDSDEEKTTANKWREANLKYVTIHQIHSKGIHYLV